MNLRNTNRAWSLVSPLFIAVYFVIYTRGALHTYFSNDDVTNLYRGWIYPVALLVKANLLFFLNSPFFRPFAEAWYRAIYAMAGFNPLPFHAVNLVILGGDIWLTYCVSRRLSGSRAVGAVAALLISYHPGFGELYFDTGYIFDVLCYFFYFSALLLYVRIRQQGRSLDGWELAALCALYICALNSKEMAVTLPAFLAIYELLYSRVPWRSLTRLISVSRGVIVIGLLTLVFTIGRFVIPSNNSLTSNSAYRPEFSWGQFMKTSANFFGELFLQKHPIRHGAVLIIWIALLAGAWITKSRALTFAWLFLMLGAIPVAFILPRGAAQYYVPFFGWVLYAAVVFVGAAEYVSRGIPQHVRIPVMLTAVAVLLFPFYGKTGWADVVSAWLDAEELRSTVDQLHTLRPKLRPGARIVFLNDPIDDDYRLKFLVHLSYGDSSLIVDRVKAMTPPPTADAIASYDYLFDYRLGQFYTSRQSPPEGPEPVMVFEGNHPGVFHSDFSRVTTQSPAKPDEHIIAMVKDLGATNPPVPLDRPFPRDPLLHVAGPVSVRIGGKLAKLLTQISWPEKIDIYRVDFIIPRDAGHGQVTAQITANGITGPEVSIPVK